MWIKKVNNLLSRIGINRVCTDVFYQLACPPMCPQDYVNPWKAGIAHISSPVEIHPTKSPKNPPTTYALDIMEGSGTSLELRLTYSVSLNGILGVLGRSDPRSPARCESGSKPGARIDAMGEHIQPGSADSTLDGLHMTAAGGRSRHFSCYFMQCLQCVSNMFT